jgi:hypothetical protein
LRENKVAQVDTRPLGNCRVGAPLGRYAFPITLRNGIASMGRSYGATIFSGNP